MSLTAIAATFLPMLINAGKKVVGEKITEKVLGKTDRAGKVIAKGELGSKTNLFGGAMLGGYLYMTVPPALEGNWYAIGMSIAGLACYAGIRWGRKTAKVPLGKG